jgi:hypothetical protein
MGMEAWGLWRNKEEVGQITFSSSALDTSFLTITGGNLLATGSGIMLKPARSGWPGLTVNHP